MKNKEIKYILKPILAEQNKKLDCENLKRALLNKYGGGTAAWNNFGFSTYNTRFEEREGYLLQAEIWIYDEIGLQADIVPRFVVGQSGLFIKIEEKTTFITVNDFLAKYNSFIEFVKAYLFSPIGVAHWSDGDCYLRNDYDVRDCKRAGVLYALFENEEDNENGHVHQN